jgi:predicted metal-dependent HD superfamily phosphohydrolase
VHIAARTDVRGESGGGVVQLAVPAWRVCQDGVVEAEWLRAVCVLGGDRQVAEAAAVALAARYAEPHRRYHDRAHLQAVLRDSAILAEELQLPFVERALLAVAAAAHDVVYDGQPGEDERRSAVWAREWLVRAGVGEVYVARVEALVLATLAHTARSDDLTALALLDADLAILGADQAAYDRYRAAVREEYAAFDERTWRAGRAAVMSDLLARAPLYATAAARGRWEAAARANIARELDSLQAENRLLR